MKVSALAIPEVLLVEPTSARDARGVFLETWRHERYERAGIPGPFVQDNLSYSDARVLRGLHLQWPRTQGKLVTVSDGRVFDVAVDVRRGSPTFGNWVGAELSSENHHQLWVPPGFAHGFVVLGQRATLQYKLTAGYAPEDEVTIAWNDPQLRIDWPVSDPVLSERDAAARHLAAIPEHELPVMPDRP
jgi:dTDP-4-dehydrorhamnose 3,5-epimerase